MGLNLNMVLLAGYVGKDPETKVFDNEDGSKTYITNFTLGVSTGYGKSKKTTWFDCRCFAQKAQAFAKYVVKGANVFVRGHEADNNYKKQDGTMIYRKNLVVVDDWQFCLSKKETSADGGGADAAPIADEGDKFMEIPDGIEEELPFA